MAVKMCGDSASLQQQLHSRRHFWIT